MKNLLDNLIVTNVYGCFEVHSDENVQRTIKKRGHYGLIFSTSGQVEYSHQGKIYTTDKNRFILLPSGVSYTLKCTKQDVSYVINFDCNLKIDEFHEFQITRKDLSNDILNALVSFRTGLNGWQTALRSLIYNVLTPYCQQYAFGTLPKHLIKSIDYVYSHYTDSSLNNAEIAAHAGISQIYLQKEFVKYLLVSPKRFIQNIRISKAKDLLYAEHYNASEIALLVGYNSLYHFCRIFKKETGRTPLQFRKENKLAL